MSTYTTNYNMTKPEAGDFVDIDVLNDNFDIIDDQLKDNADDIADKQDRLTFDAAPTSGSGNPVTSAGVYDAIQEVSTALANEASTARAAEGANAQAIQGVSAALASEASTARAAEGANAQAITVLNGDAQTAGSVANTVATYIAELIADAPASLDTLKEIADWIEDHAEDAAAMNSRINSNTSAITAERTRAQTAETANANALQAYKDLLGLTVDEDGYICQTI